MRSCTGQLLSQEDSHLRKNSFSENLSYFQARDRPGTTWSRRSFSEAGFGETAEIVLRPGCYLTHDVGAYRVAQAKILERNPIAHQMHSGLVPAITCVGLCALDSGS